MSLVTYAFDGILSHNSMKWEVEFHTEFELEFESLSEAIQDELLAKALLLAEFGSGLGRPHVDTLNGSAHCNMKELRFNAADGVWRVAFAFDPKRRAILLVAGDKSGESQTRFYKTLIKTADRRFNQHLQQLKGD
jgi:hypothetical protein